MDVVLPSRVSDDRHMHTQFLDTNPSHDRTYALMSRFMHDARCTHMATLRFTLKVSPLTSEVQGAGRDDAGTAVAHDAGPGHEASEAADLGRCGSSQSYVDAADGGQGRAAEGTDRGRGGKV